jgi:hypothetical protein
VSTPNGPPTPPAISASATAILPPKVLRFSYFPILLDQLCRFVVLFLWSIDWVPTWFFWLIQVIIPFGVVVNMQPRFEKLQKKYGTKVLVAQSSILAVSYAWIAFLIGVIAVLYVTSSLSGWFQFPLTVASMLAYGPYLGGLYGISVQDKPPRVVRSYFPSVDLHESLGDSADTNDLQIVAMEVELSSISQRVEGYTMESTLLGGLAFSGFLSLLASERPIIENMRTLLAEVPARWIQASHFDSTVLHLSLDQALALIGIETLLCSALFLAVVLSRLKYYAMLRQVQYAVQVARVWNEKEEQAQAVAYQHVSVTIQSRLQQLGDLVANAIQHALPLVDDLRAIVRYIFVLRMTGIGMFLIILFTGALVISTNLGIIIIAIMSATLAYSGYDHRRRHSKLRNAPFFRRFFRL